jgi:hypothetical protein
MIIVKHTRDNRLLGRKNGAMPCRKFVVMKKKRSPCSMRRSAEMAGELAEALSKTRKKPLGTA